MLNVSNLYRVYRDGETDLVIMYATPETVHIPFKTKEDREKYIAEITEYAKTKRYGLEVYDSYEDATKWR